MSRTPKPKRYTQKQVDELIREALATCLGMCCSTLRRHGHAETALEFEVKDAHVRAAEIHGAKVLGRERSPEEELAALLPSRALADGMKALLAPEATAGK